MVHRVDKDLRPRSVLRVEFDQYTHIVKLGRYAYYLLNKV